MKFYVSLFSFLFSAILLKAQVRNNFDWLIGNWKTTKNKITIIESWKKENDSLYVGFSGYIKNKDTIPEETIELKKIGSDWNFIPTTANQNNGKPVSFRVILIQDKEFICENLQHDFPQRISYRLFGKNLFASIEGNINGVFKKSNFDYTKQP